MTTRVHSYQQSNNNFQAAKSNFVKSKTDFNQPFYKELTVISSESEILSHLTLVEKAELTSVRQKLAQLTLPDSPSDSSDMQEYNTYYNQIQMEISSLKLQESELLLKGDKEKHCPNKKSSPFRVYKRETASSIKKEFPLMSNEERAQIVRDRWAKIDDAVKSYYVTLARIEEQVDQYQKIKEFYNERVETARLHAKKDIESKPLPSNAPENNNQAISDNSIDYLSSENSQEKSVCSQERLKEQKQLQSDELRNKLVNSASNMLGVKPEKRLNIFEKATSASGSGDNTADDCKPDRISGSSNENAKSD